MKKGTSYLLLSLQDSDIWNDKLHKLPISQQDVYYTPEYYSLYQNYGDGTAYCFVYTDENDILLYPFLMNSINELGYQLKERYYDIQGAYGYNGVISSSNSSSFISDFHESFDKWCSENNIVAEFTRFNPLIDNYKLASPLMQLINDRLTVKLNLQLDIENIWMQQFNSSNRNHIRKAEKKGVYIEESKDYNAFIRLYEETMRKVGAEDYYFFPKNYFDELKELCDNNGLLCYAMYEGKPISGAVIMFSDDYAHYHLGARDLNYNKIAAQNVVFWYSIQKAKERGCKWFHFGGGTSGDENDKLLHYKRFFSQDTGEFWIGKRIHNQLVYDTILEQWKKMFPKSWNVNKNKLLGYRIK